MTDSDEEQLLGIATFAGIVTTFVLEPFAVASMWGWFVVPLGLPGITWAQACGMNLLIAVVRFRYTPPIKERAEQMTRAWANVAQMLAGWGIAWIVMRLSQ